MIYICSTCNYDSITVYYTLSLHDALPICVCERIINSPLRKCHQKSGSATPRALIVNSPKEKMMANTREVSKSRDRKSTRLNSSHANISYAVFCLKKKIDKKIIIICA